MQRIILPINSLLVVLILLALARILADFASHSLGAFSPEKPIVATRGSHAQNQPAALGSYASILSNGLLGPAAKGTLTQIAALASSAAPASGVAQSDLVLLGTVTGSVQAGFAVIRRLSSNEERVFKVGDKIFDLGTLSTVQKNSARLKAGSQTIILKTPDSPTKAWKPASSSPAAQHGSAGVILSAGGTGGIIEQRALNAALENIGQATTDARMLPSVKDGKVEGFRLSEVKPQGIFGAIGLKNGDVLQNINDFPIDSPEKAIQSFMALKGQSRIKLDLIRDGAQTSLSYEIR